MKKTTILLILIIILASVLRLVALDKFPWGLNADEAAIGYNAYSLIQTGHDEHGVSWPLEFRSFDDFKPPVYFYLVLPFVKVLGLNIWAVRLPSALLGIATVYLTYLLAVELLTGRRSDLERKPLSGWAHDEISGRSDLIGMISALLLAISPWHLQYSRGGWEVNASLFFLILGLWSFFKGLKNTKYLFLWVVGFVVSMYTYHSMRVVAPLLGFYLIIANWNLFVNWYLKIENYKANFRTLIISIILGFVLLLPLAFQFLGGAGASARFAGVSIFADSGPLSYVLEMRRTSANPNSVITKIIYNRYTAYAGDFIKNFASHFSPSFLFISGDEIARNKVPGMGQSYIWTLPFFLLGLWFILKKPNKKTFLIIYWMLVGVIPAALTFQSPHALRSENIVVPFMIIIAAGIWSVFVWISELKIRNSKIILLLASVIFFVMATSGLAYYLKQYYVAYPNQLGYAWQPGFDQMARYFEDNGDKYDKIIVSTRYDQPYILVAFFLKYPPAKFQKELIFSKPDKFGFSTGIQFGKYYFHKIDWQTDSQEKNALIVVADEPVGPHANLVKTIPFPNDQSVFRLYATSPTSDVKLLAR